MTLTEASSLARRGLVLFGIAAVVYYIFLLLFFPGAKALFNALFPEKDPPNPVFGQLAPLEFTEKKTKGDFDPDYKLDTSDGRLPRDLPSKMTVYEIRKTVPSFEKGKDARNTAAELGYYDDDLVTSLKEPIYRWKKLSSEGFLEIDTDNRNLSLYTALNNKASFYPKGTLSYQRATELAQDIFKKIGRFDDQLYINGYKRVTLGKFFGITLREAESVSDTQIARVDFYRSINDIPILGNDPDEGMLFVYLRKPQKEDIHYNYPVMESRYWEIVQNSPASYPIISVEDAWNFIKQNKGVVAGIVPEGTTKLTPYVPVLVERVFVNNVYLAYYDSISEQPYLQPVYVFSGKYTTVGTQGGEITIYYPAVAPEYIKSEN